MKTILYIDHSESHRLLLQEELAEEGYRVVIKDGIEETLSKRRQFVWINGDGY
jgi:CheY-like chemotaxis protein